MDEVDEDLEEGQEIRAFGWFFLDFVHNALTAGFQHEYSAAYDAHEQGWTTDDEFHSSATKALGKAAVILGASALTGGVAGELAGGLAEGLGAGRSAAQLIAGGVGGFASGVGGHFAGDAYDQMVNGKQGFDSFGSYMRSGAEGGAMGAALAGVSLAAGSFLPTSAARTVDIYAQRYPRMTRVLEDIRATGFGSGAAVRMKVGELLDLLGSGFGGPGGPSAFAYATVGDVRALPPDAEISVRMRPLRPLTQPMQMSKAGEGQGDDLQTAGATDKATTADEQVVAIEQVEVVTDPLAPVETPVVDGMSLDPAVWVERMKAMLTPDELAKFEQMTVKKSPEKIQAQYQGNFDAALRQIKGATAKGQVSADRGLASQARAAELRAIIDSRGLMKDPRVRAIVDRYEAKPNHRTLETAISDLRNVLVGDVLEAELAARYPGTDVLRDVDVWVEQPGTVDEFLASDLAKKGNYDIFDDHVYVKSTDIDMLVIERSVDGGKARIVHREEVKTGTTDTQARAKPQLHRGAEEISKAAAGNQRIRLRIGDRDITERIDLSSVDQSTGATRGPLGKPEFNENLGITAGDLEKLIQSLLELELAARKGSGGP